MVYMQTWIQRNTTSSALDNVDLSASTLWHLAFHVARYKLHVSLRAVSKYTDCFQDVNKLRD